MYSYESSATPVTDCTTNYSASCRQRGRPKTKSKAIFRQRKEKVKSGRGPPKGCPTPRHTDWLTVSRKVTSISTSTSTSKRVLISAAVNDGQERLGVMARSWDYEELWGSRYPERTRIKARSWDYEELWGSRYPERTRSNGQELRLWGAVRQ
jgi:hypothetical protein